MGYAALTRKGDYCAYSLAIAMIYLTVNFGVVLFLKLREHRSPEYHQERVRCGMQ
jgi:hypothetical protein